MRLQEGTPTVFSAGLDLPTMSKFSRPQMEEWFAEFSDTLEDIALSPLVVITAISGHAPAGGAVLAAMTDYRVAQQGNFLIGLNETRVVTFSHLHLQSGWPACP